MSCLDSVVLSELLQVHVRTTKSLRSCIKVEQREGTRSLCLAEDERPAVLQSLGKGAGMKEFQQVR